MAKVIVAVERDEDIKSISNALSGAGLKVEDTLVAIRRVIGNFDGDIDTLKAVPGVKHVSLSETRRTC